MFGKILVANRGEIACRIMATARRMGIGTVAVYSDADTAAPHVEMADEAVRIGPAPAAQSYLLIDAILDACAKTGAEAVHPGYGFLSERAAFPEALAKVGLTFIGPNPAAIEAMGDKIESKARAMAAGVSTVPGGAGALDTAEAALEVAEAIGYPVMIKASAGGGGKGMRIAHSAAEVKEGFDRARSEAKNAFGDDRVFVEKFIVDPRHIEIQVLGDKHGNVIHLLERECSIQRRNQKVLEEAPSPLLDAETRAQMGAEAVALAKAVAYDSAGTVEFVASQDADFYFLEMNTRLQVEHPVTELITGVDLVEQMIRVAAGEPLTLTQDDVEATGWAVEARLYAEDPDRNFLPSIGRLKRLKFPEPFADETTLRIDTGVVEGSEISRFYDPMIAKIITHGPDRAAAIAAMSDALDATVIDGISPNTTFLAALMDHPRWQSGALSTGFIAEEFSGRGSAPLTDDTRAVFAAVAAALTAQAAERKAAFGPHKSPEPRALAVLFDDDARLDTTIDGGGDTFRIAAGTPHDITLTRDGALIHAMVNGRAKTFTEVRNGAGLTLTHRGMRATMMVLRPDIADLMVHLPKVEAGGGAGKVLCPMPGLVVSLSVKEGDTIEEGHTIAVIEAMKMENVIRAERSGTVRTVKVAAGDSLAVDAVIMEYA
ncbi:MAG: acetyl/propionyl/methylcrotonyl-CoA carboxylase subunit alpha [Pseudomonadota bacterium]